MEKRQEVKVNSKKLIGLLVMGTFMFAAALPCASSAAARRAEVDYDRLTALGLQLLENGSFERMNRAGNMPANWGVPREVADRFKVVTDAKRSKHGATYVTFRPDRLRYLYGHLKSIPSGKLLAQVWAKGEGRLYLIVTAMAKNARVRKIGTLARKVSPWFSVKGEHWVQCVHRFDIPEFFEAGGKRERAGAITVQIGIKGKVSLDACSVVSVQKLEALGSLAAAKKKPTDLRPFFTMPRLRSAPKIDGRIGPDEWQGAAAVTGFTQLNTRNLASRQTVVYAGYCGERLYFAFRCPHEGRFGAGKPGRDRGWDMQTEAVEVWLQPRGGQWYQFLGWPGGGIMDINQKDGMKWNGHWEFANRIQDAGETVGGILLFAKKIWTAEVSIPVRDLGTTTPKPGDVWRVNFCRDFSVPRGKARTEDDWTSWSPLAGGFNNVAKFGMALFAEDAPVVQILKVGDLQNGQLSLEGHCGGRKAKVRVEARAALAEGDKTVSFQSKTIETAQGKLSKFALIDTLKVSGATEINFQITVEDAEGGRLLARSLIPFTAMAALRAKAIPVPSQRLLYVNVDASRVPELPAQFKVETEILRDGSSVGIVSSTDWTKDNCRGDLKVSLANLPPGNYQARTSVKRGRKGKPLASCVAPFVIPERPDWLGNKTGISNEVPAPWRPVQVSGNHATITDREYRLADTGLPEQVTDLGEEIFAARPRLQVVVDGRMLAWRCRPLKLIERTEGRVVWQIDGNAGPLSMRGTLKVEFDGFALWDVLIRSGQALAVDSLALVFPFKKERALYARGRNATEHAGAYNACLYETKTPSVSDICGSHFSSSGWVWPEAWVHDIWVGDDTRGFSVMCETQEYLRGTKRTEIERGPRTHALKIHLIDGRYEVRRPLKYRYAWQATPVKPRPKDPKLWHATYKRIEEDGFLKRVYVGTDYHALKYISYPVLFLPKRAVDGRNAIFRKAGVKLVPYFATEGVTTEASDLKPFLREWESYPVRTIGGVRGGWIVACSANPSFADFIIYSAEKVVFDLGLDGLYLDVSSCHACSNHYHGCGWWDEERSKWQPTVNVFAAREAYKRLYNVMKRGGRNAVIFRHGMPVAAVAGFVDVVTQGEDWCREGTEQYDRLTPDIFRAKSMRIQYGTPYTWYTFHHYYRGIKFGGRVPLDAILAYCLPHRVLPTVGRKGIWRVWDVMDEFWTTAEFIPYWDPRTPIQIDEARVLGSVYWKKDEKKALLVVANWNTKPRTVDVRIDLAKLGMNARELRITRALKHPIRHPKDPPVKTPMPDGPLVLRSGKLRVWLAGRNLEVILLENRRASR